MRMEFVVDPDDASRLSRSKLLARQAGSRPRYRTELMVWHDSPNLLLWTDGLVLEERRGLWRLERLTPAEETWLPTQSPPELAQALVPADLNHPLPDETIQIARFDGRRATTMLETAAGPVTMELLRGSAGTAAIARLTLDGADVAVRDLALALAGEFHLTVPTTSLAAEAIGACRGAVPPPRHLGAPEPFVGTSITDAFGAAIGHAVDVLLYFAPMAATGGPDTEPVHQMRVAVRRARSAIAAFKHGLACPDVLAADRELKALGAVLGPARDWDVLVTETLARVRAMFPDDGRLGRLARAAQREREVHQADMAAYLRAPAFRQAGVALAWLCASQSWHATLTTDEQAVTAMEPSAYAALVLQRRWKKVSTAGKSIRSLDAPALHNLRLRAKRARYAIEIFRPRDHSRPAHKLIRRLSKLQEHLGTLNDGAVAAGLLDELGGPGGRHGYAIGLVLGFLAASASIERPAIIRAWEKFRRAPRFWS